VKDISYQELGIEHKKYDETLVATIWTSINKREEMYSILDRLNQNIQEENILGPAFCIYVYVTSVEGFDVELGYPVSKIIETDEVKTRILSEMEVLSFIHEGPVEQRRESYKKLYSFTEEHGIISDEFTREIFLDSNDPEGNKIELQFIIHDWNGLFEKRVDRVLGEEKKQEVMKGSENISFESPLEDKFHWIKCAIKRLEDIIDENQMYNIISGCTHVFPKNLINKMKEVYQEARKDNNPYEAVDTVLEFMEKDRAWIKIPFREGKVLYATKNPRDPKGQEEAKDDAERRKAYCFCPVIRNNLDKKMPFQYCYCGAGWYRQQWEGVFDKPVRIDIVKSVLQGDDRCSFAIHIPDDL
jgi:effector-binding domain-containing protein